MKLREPTHIHITNDGFKRLCGEPTSTTNWPEHCMADEWSKKLPICPKCSEILHSTVNVVTEKIPAKMQLDIPHVEYEIVKVEPKSIESNESTERVFITLSHYLD